MGGWRGDVGRQPGQESQAAGPQIRSLAPTGACRSGLSKAWRGKGDNFFLYGFSYDFVLNDLDDFTLEKNHPGVGRGPARLKLFNSTHPEVE